VTDEIFNIAFTEPKRLLDLLHEIALKVGVPESKMSGLFNTQGDSGDFYFPSVLRGPIDCSKAKNLLQFEAAEWSVAIRDIAEFYQRALIGSPDERDEVVKDLLTDLNDQLPEANKMDFLNEIEKTSGSKRQKKR